MSQEKTDFTNLSVQRPNYFPGQYLLEDDFELQHKYLSDRQKYYNQSLHVSGIIKGLEVEVVQDKKVVQIKSGSALDSQGNLIVLNEDKTFNNFKSITEGVLCIEYMEEKQERQQDKIDESYRRWREQPQIKFVAINAVENGIKLAKLTVNKDDLALDTKVREYSGISLPNANGKALTLRSGGNKNLDLAVLNGSLKIDRNLIVNEIRSEEINTAKITCESLNVNNSFSSSNGKVRNILTIGDEETARVNRDWMKKGTNITWNSDNLFVGLKDEGSNHKDAVIAWGDDDNNDLRFINVPYGKADKEVVRVKADGKVGIGTINPSQKLEVDGNIKASGNLTVTGTISGKIDAKKIISGTLYADRIPNLSANKITSGTLSVDRIPNLSANKITSGTLEVNRIPQLPTNKITWGEIKGSLSVTGAITPSVGDSSNNGIMFPENYFGGSGHAAWIRYYKRGSAGEATTLEIGTSDGTDDHIALMPKAGNVGIGTNNPQAKLHIKQTVNSSGIRIDENDSDRYFRIAYEGQGNIHFYHKTDRGQWMGSDGKWNHNSDISLKKNILSVHNILDKVLQLNPVYFAWKNNETNDNETNDIGFIAQEVEQVFPELVSSVNISGNDIKGLPYASFGVLAIAAIKDLKNDYDTKIKSLEATIYQLVNGQKLS